MSLRLSLFGFLVILLIIGLAGRRNAALADDRITAELGKEKVNSGALLIDVRTAEEFAEGHVEGAINVPHDKIEERLNEIGQNKNREIVLYCRSGRRSGIAQQTLREHGYQAVFNGGGYDEWLQPTTSSH